MAKLTQYGGAIFSAECPVTTCHRRVRMPPEMSVNKFCNPRAAHPVIGRCSKHGSVKMPFVCYESELAIA